MSFFNPDDIPVTVEPVEGTEYVKLCARLNVDMISVKVGDIEDSDVKKAILSLILFNENGQKEYIDRAMHFLNQWLAMHKAEKRENNDE